MAEKKRKRIKKRIKFRKKNFCPRCKIKVPFYQYLCKYCGSAISNNLTYVILSYGILILVFVMIILYFFLIYYNRKDTYVPMGSDVMDLILLGFFNKLRKLVYAENFPGIYKISKEKS